MIQVILLILKIIGITLAVLLGLLLLVLALVLFVPIFYRVKIVHNPEKTQVDGRVRFMFPLLSFTFQYLKKFTYKGKLLWYVFLDSEKPKKEKTEKTDGKKKSKKAKKSKKKQNAQEETAESISEEPIEPIEPEETPSVSDPPEEPEQAGQKTEAEERAETGTKEEVHSTEKTGDKPGFFESLRLKIEKIRDTITKIIQKIKKLLHQKDEVLRILKKPSSKQAISFVWDKLKHLLKHILPRKIKGYVAYGANDPATTGQALAVISVIYAKIGPLLEIRPNFEEPQMECDVELSGHIQVFVLVVIAVKVLFKPELRELIDDFKNLKNVDNCSV